MLPLGPKMCSHDGFLPVMSGEGTRVIEGSGFRVSVCRLWLSCV